MASAFQAGMIGGFADTFVQKIQDRTDKAEKYEDMMIASAKANAPKYAETTAAYKATVSQARQLKDSFGFTDSEIVAMASKYDLNAIHKTLMEQKMAAEANASELGFDKSTILGSLNMASSITMPKGMTLESGLRNILFNTTQNLNASNNPKSEVNKRGAFGKAMADFLALNPRASAEEQLKSMQYAGFSMDELRNFNASAGRGDIFPEVTAGPLALPDQDYKSSDFASTQAKTRTTFARNFKVLNEATADIDASLAKNFKNPANGNVIDIFKDIETASEYMAFLESNIAFKGYGAGFGNELKRTGALSRLIRSIDTPEELKAFVAAERDGRFTKLIIETDGTFTDTQLEAVLNGEPIPGVEPEEETSVDAAGTDPLTETSTAAAASGPAPLSPDAAINAKVAELTGGTTGVTDLSDIGMDRREAAYEDDSVPSLDLSDIGMDRREAAYEDDTIKPLVKSIAAGAATSEWIDSLGLQLPSTEDLNTSIVSNLKTTNSAVASGLATAVDFLTGFVGGTEETRLSKGLKNISKNQADSAAKVAAMGFTEYFTSDLPPKEVVNEVEDNFVKLFTTATDTPAYKQLEELIRERMESAEKKKAEEPSAVNEVFTPEFPGDVPEDLENATTSEISKALSYLTELPDVIHQSLFDAQDKINASIAALFEETLEERIMKNEGQRNRVVALQALKDKISDLRKKAEVEQTVEPEPLVTRPKKPLKPKGMTASDKARLQRAQKARELGKDTGLLEMLVEKYGIALVQKEMGL